MLSHLYRRRWWISAILIFLGFGVSLYLDNSVWATAPVLCAAMIHLYEFERRYMDTSTQMTATLKQLKFVQEGLGAVRGYIMRDAVVIAAIGAVLESTGGNSGNESSEPIHKMARNALISLLAGPYTTLVQDLNRFSSKGSDHLTFDSRRLAELSTAELVELLPPGSVWCGITRVASKAWQGEALQRYLLRSRQKVRGGEMKMFRIYGFSPK